MTRVEPPTGAREASGRDAGADLMMRIREGDRHAFEELVGLYQGTVLNAAFKYIGNRAVAEELTQDAFVRIYRARHTYEPTAKFDTWLYRIVFNLCANAAEYGRRRQTLSLSLGTGNGRVDQDEVGDVTPGDPEAATPLQNVQRNELREQVREAIGRLPDQQRAALVMSRYQGMPYQEIALALETSVEAVKSLLFRARENLKGLLVAYVQEEVRDEH